VTQPPKSFFLSAAVHDYLVRHGTPPDAVQRELIEDTRRLGPIAVMQIPPEQGALLTLVARLLDARRALEIGTFTGYSTLCLARGLPEDGRVLTLDVNPDWTALARRHWEKAGLAHKIELRLGPALDSLRGLPAAPPFDLAFLDADKPGYPAYYEEVLRLLRPNGLLVVDNVLWMGRVADPDADDAETRHIRAFNELVARDPRVECVMLAVADGLSLVRKR
jgi:caffeoyl-CoA O-methyltransferase